MARSPAAVRVWDLPLRVFHWALVLCIIGSLVSITIGGNWMAWHMRFGYCILALMLFRVVWGFVGSRYARFGDFLSGPANIVRYLRGAPEARASAGHNPLGSLSVVAMIVLLLAQATMGLFANDDVFTEGPLVKFISKETSDAITGWHHLNGFVICVLIVLHLAAIAFYRFARDQRLVRAMVGGDKRAGSDGLDAVSIPAAADDGAGTRIRGLVVFALCAALVWWIVTR